LKQLQPFAVKEAFGAFGGSLAFAGVGTFVAFEAFVIYEAFDDM